MQICRIFALFGTPSRRMVSIQSDAASHYVATAGGEIKHCPGISNVAEPPEPAFYLAANLGKNSVAAGGARRAGDVRLGKVTHHAGYPDTRQVCYLGEKGR